MSAVVVIIMMMRNALIHVEIIIVIMIELGALLGLHIFLNVQA
jgi:hypothetical protein